MVARLRGVRSRFVPWDDFATLAAAPRFDDILTLLHGRLYEDEAATLAGAGKGVTRFDLVAMVDRVIDRQRKKFARMIPRRREARGCHTAALMGWELEEVKAALRLRSVRGPLEKRPPFVSYILSLTASRDIDHGDSVASFLAGLVRHNHPAAAGVDADIWRERPAVAEREMERHCVQRYLAINDSLPAMVSLATLFLDRINLHRALLFAFADEKTERLLDWHLAGPGRVTADAFRAIADGGSEGAKESVAALFGVHLPEGIDTPSAIVGRVRGGALKRLRLQNMIDPVTPGELILFAEELDVQSANLKLALMAGGAEEKETILARMIDGRLS